MRWNAVSGYMLIAMSFIGQYSRSAELEKSTAGGWENVLPKSTHAKFHSIVFNSRIGEKQGYEKDIRELVAIDPKNAIVLSCGAGLAGLYGDFDLGNELSKAAVEADPKQPKAWNVRGEIQFNRAKYPEAVEAFTKAIEFGSGDSLAQRYYMRGMSYSRLEQRLAFAKLALDDLETARKLNDRADWMFAHTTILYETLRMEDALTLLNAYIERMPDDPQGAVMRAMTLIVLERPEDADKEFSRLKNLDSKRAEQEPMFRKSAEDARGEYAKLKKLAEDPAQLLKLLEPNNRPKK